MLLNSQLTWADMLYGVAILLLFVLPLWRKSSKSVFRIGIDQGAMDCDLDVSALALDAEGKLLGTEWFVFYGNTSSPGGAVRHAGSFGENMRVDGCYEELVIDTAALPREVERLAIVVSTYHHSELPVTFGDTEFAHISLVDDGDAEIASWAFDDHDDATAAVFGELRRVGSEWRFFATLQAYSDGLAGLLRSHGLQVV